MPSQLEYLRESLARLEAKGFSSDNPMVKGLRGQIAMHERRQRREQTGGYFDEDGKIKPEWQKPMGCRRLQPLAEVQDHQLIASACAYCAGVSKSVT